MTERDYAQKLADILAYTRTFVGISQAEMARRIGMSKNTVQNWESGSSTPNLIQTIKWFHALDLNPIPSLKLLAINTIEYNMEDSDEDAREIAKRNIDQMTRKEVDCFNYIMSSTHGSSPYAILQEVAMNLMCPLGDRQTVATIIQNNYENAKCSKRLSDQDKLQPDVDAFNNALEEGTRAYREGKIGYFKMQLE